MAGSIKKESSNGTWYYVLELGRDPITDKRIQKKKRGFKTKKEAQTALTEAEHEINTTGNYLKPSQEIYENFLKSHLQDKKYTTSKQTADVTDSIAKIHIIPYLGKISLSKITPTHIQGFITHLRSKNLADGTIKRIFNIVNTSLAKAEKLQLIRQNPAQLVDKPTVSKKKLIVWDLTQSKKYLQTTKSSRYHIVYLLALMTGMRQGEILGLRFSDIDYEKSKLSILQTLSHDGKYFKIGAKTTSGNRSIALDKETLNTLQLHQERITNEKNKAGNIYSDLNLVCCNEIGLQTRPRDIVKWHYKHISNAELPKIKFHDLRHTHATLLLNQNVHPKVVSERLGHASIQITLDTYSHLLPNMQEEVAEKLGALLFEDT